MAWRNFLFNEFGMSSSGLDLYSASSLFTETTVHMHFNMAHIRTSSNTDLVVTSKDILCSYLPSQRSREARLIYCYPTFWIWKKDTTEICFIPWPTPRNWRWIPVYLVLKGSSLLNGSTPHRLTKPLHFKTGYTKFWYYLNLNNIVYIVEHEIN
jgi:hypothetical protein